MYANTLCVRIQELWPSWIDFYLNYEKRTSSEYIWWMERPPEGVLNCINSTLGEKVTTAKVLHHLGIFWSCVSIWGELSYLWKVSNNFHQAQFERKAPGLLLWNGAEAILSGECLAGVYPSAWARQPGPRWAFLPHPLLGPLNLTWH